MSKYYDSLRGYAYHIHKRDDFKCRYCGLDGKSSLQSWLSLSLDHLLPTNHPNREDDKYKVTACKFCNSADNLFFIQAKKRGLKFDGMSPDALVEQRRPHVLATRQKYEEFWVKNIKIKKKTRQS